MTLVIGTDEAGYGPNLGPLVIGATAWRLAAEPAEAEATLADTTAAADAVVGGRLWGDSKQLYRGGAGLDVLGRGVLAAISLADVGSPATWPELATALGIDGSTQLPERSALDVLAVPQHGRGTLAPELETAVGRALAARGVAVVAVRGRMVTPGEFNGLLDHGLNKSDILSAATLELAAELAAVAAAAEPVVIWCDRHGGRRRYAPQVMRAFSAALVQPVEETPQRSAYRLGSDRSIEFTVGGEARLPVAVASMTAKYVRELAMLAFNAFWTDRQPGLEATAGYPVDACRWRKHATAAVDRAGVSWDTIWRRV